MLIVQNSDHRGTYNTSAPGTLFLPANLFRQPLSDFYHETFLCSVLELRVNGIIQYILWV